MGKGAVFLKEAASGRVGILPNILPEPPVAAADVCGPRASRSYPYPYNGQQTSSCMLGGGGTKVRLQGPGRYGGLTDLTGGMVTRNNAGGGNVTIYADLWLDESGSYTTATAPASGASDADITAYNQAIQKGWAGKTATAQGAGSGTNWLTDVAWAAVLHGATPGASASTAGVTVADANTGASATATPDAQAEITIAPSSSYCPTRAGSRQTTATVLILAFPGGTDLDGADGDLPALPDDVGGVNQIHPALATDKDDGYHAVASITVGCPPRSSSSANPGQELVPENLFPTDG
ncbi:MAG: hypothetical protein F4018_11845 [Acidobacteria bacterium]|nr:hypothetical protein [Acidobacteriota bacterium]